MSEGRRKLWEMAKRRFYRIWWESFEIGTNVKFKNKEKDKIWWTGTVTDVSSRFITVYFPSKLQGDYSYYPSYVCPKSDKIKFDKHSALQELIVTKRKVIREHQRTPWTKYGNKYIKIGDKVKCKKAPGLKNGVVSDIVCGNVCSVKWKTKNGKNVMHIYFAKDLEKIKD